MFYINMGIAIFLSQIVPIGSVILSIMRMFPTFFKSMHISNTILGTVLILVSLVILYIAAHFITKHQKLRERLPTVIPGTNFIISGLALYFLFKGALIFASTVEGGGASYTVRQLGVFIIYPAYFLIGIGIYKAYKALSPVNVNP